MADSLRPDLDPHWEMTQQHANDISELKAGQARLEVGVQGLGNKIDTAIHSMNNLMQQVNKPAEKPNLLGLVTTACVVGGLLGALAMSIISPIKHDLQIFADRQHQHFQDRVDEAYESGRYHQKLDDLKERVVHLDELDHVRDEHLLELFKAMSGSEVSRSAIGDYLKEHTSKSGMAGHPKNEVRTHEPPPNR